jgi:hypothetical protein
MLGVKTPVNVPSFPPGVKLASWLCSFLDNLIALRVETTKIWLFSDRHSPISQFPRLNQSPEKKYSSLFRLWAKD